MAMLHKMRKIGMGADVISFGAAILACMKGQQWEQTLTLLHEKRKIGMVANVISFRAAFSAYE